MVPATTNDLARAPELALLDHALALLVARHPEIARRDGDLVVGLPPQVWVADHLAAAMHDLQRLLLHYRQAAAGAARHHARKPSTHMPLPHHPRFMRRYERTSTLFTSNRPVEDWGKLFGDAAAVAAMLDRLLHHGHVLKCGPRSWANQDRR